MEHEVRLPGGRDTGAWRVGDTVRRPWRPWSATVQHLLAHLDEAGAPGVPRPLGRDDQGREVLEHLEGWTVGDQRPWPAWAHADDALPQVGAWLRGYHRAVADYVPSADAVWREGGTWEPGLVVAHHDAAPYNAVWSATGLRGFIDWDGAGPATAGDDLAWLAFSWVPLHARRVVAAEGFTRFADRRHRLEALLDAYGFDGTTGDLLDALADLLGRRVEAMRATASAGDPAYAAMLARGQDRDLLAARDGLAEVG